MLTEQKRYLYPPYLLLNAAAILFFFFGAVTFSLPLPHLSQTLFIWTTGYLLPALFLCWLFCRHLWFWGDIRQVGFGRVSRGRRGVWMAVLIVGAVAFICGFHGWCMAFGFREVPVAPHLPLMGMGYALAMALPLATKTVMVRMVRRSGPRSNFIKSVVIAGTGGSARQLAEDIHRHPEWGVRVSGFLGTGATSVGEVLEGHPVLAPIQELGGVLKTCVADMVVVAVEKDAPAVLQAVLVRCRLEGVDVASLAASGVPRPPGARKIRIGPHLLWRLRFVAPAAEKLFFKRLFDMTAAMLLCCLSAPLWVLLPVLIRRDAPGPALFRQERAGKNGRRFIMYKFRSMVVDAEDRRQALLHLNEMDGPAFKMEKDPRVTRLGALLRKTSLDELPQLLNVIRGDISLVGPRPPLIEEVVQYRPWEKKRLAVIQGITGYWQVSGRSDIRFDEWMKLDLMYVEQWHFFLDIVILFKTIPAVIARKGAR